MDWDYMVVTKPELLPAGHKAVGMGIAHSIAKTLAMAMRQQLELGVRASTVILYRGNIVK
jgi:hypothetical protein